MDLVSSANLVHTCSSALYHIFAATLVFYKRKQAVIDEVPKGTNDLSLAIAPRQLKVAVESRHLPALDLTVGHPQVAVHLLEIDLLCW